MDVPLGAGAASGRLDVTIERSGDGVLVSSPQLPGWRESARSAIGLARAIDHAFREADVAAYAARRGVPYDLTVHDAAAASEAKQGRTLPPDPDEREAALTATTEVMLATSTGGRQTPTTHHPLDWRPMNDGSWLSPAGRRYAADTRIVQQVISKRAAIGVETMPSKAAG